MSTPRPIHHIADEILQLWDAADGTPWRVRYFGAVPYLAAMRQLATVTDSYGEDDGRGVVLYFLSNVKSWRGEDAKRLKAELKLHLT